MPGAGGGAQVWRDRVLIKRKQDRGLSKPWFEASWELIMPRAPAHAHTPPQRTHKTWLAVAALGEGNGPTAAGESARWCPVSCVPRAPFPGEEFSGT